MEPAKTRSAEVGADADFLGFPIHNVVGVFDDAEAAEAAVGELRESGFSESEMAAFYGTDDDERAEVVRHPDGPVTVTIAGDDPLRTAASSPERSENQG